MTIDTRCAIETMRYRLATIKAIYCRLTKSMAPASLDSGGQVKDLILAKSHVGQSSVLGEQRGQDDIRPALQPFQPEGYTSVIFPIAFK